MPRGDGTGPFGQGPISGGDMGKRMMRGRGRMRGTVAAGPVGYCNCPNCGHKVQHLPQQPCNQQPCPKCGTIMNRT